MKRASEQVSSTDIDSAEQQVLLLHKAMHLEVKHYFHGLRAVQTSANQSSSKCFQPVHRIVRLSA